jgi:NAD(P)-dependent dehydrogenase (short-subunit alcohol dehydrogenase family)
MASLRLANRVSVVTGASSGIGREIALGLAEAGAAVCLIGRDRGRLADVAEAAQAAGARDVLAVPTDITDSEALRLAAETVEARFGDVDMLIHSAGIYARGAFEDASVEEFDEIYATNLRAPFRLFQKMLPALRRRHGDIVLISSTQGLSAHAGVGQYAASHHGLRALADSLREEVNPAGVRVTVLHVGTTATPMQERIHAARGLPYAPERLLQPRDVASMVVAVLDLPRTAEVTELTIRSMQKP